MSPGATFDRVYLALKDRLRSEDARPGDHLEPTLLSQDLASSITPVRDALHRLVGERLVEAPRNDGFRVPHLTELGLRYLYGWNAELILLATRSKAARTAPGRPFPDQEPPAATGIAAATGELYLEIAALAGNPEQTAATANLNDRLARVRGAEPELLQDAGQELARMCEALAAMDIGSLRSQISVYHRRRIRMTPHLIAALHDRA